MVKEIPAVSARQQFGGLLVGVATKRQHVVITKAEVPVAVMISTAEYHELMALKAAHGTEQLFTNVELTRDGGATRRTTDTLREDRGHSRYNPQALSRRVYPAAQFGSVSISYFTIELGS